MMQETLTRTASGSPVIYRCPSCRGDVEGRRDGAPLACGSCGHSVPDGVGGVVDFQGTEDANARAMSGWSGEVWSALDTHSKDMRERRPLAGAGVDELRAARLVDAAGRATDLGLVVAYHVLEKTWQGVGDPLRELLADHAGLTREARVLDVGCGAGHTLALLPGDEPALSVGLDCDLVSLVLARRFYGAAEGGALNLVRSDAVPLPFPDAAFTHVVSRGVLSYLPQADALREMVRVLAPGGFLGLRVEIVGFDLYKIRNAGGPPRARVGALRDLGAGLLQNLLGIPLPLGKLGGRRRYSSPRRLARLLGRLGCDVIASAPVERSAKCLGFASQQVILARRAR